MAKNSTKKTDIEQVRTCNLFIQPMNNVQDQVLVKKNPAVVCSKVYPLNVATNWYIPGSLLFANSSPSVCPSTLLVISRYLAK